jgi:hypothetical protein
MAIENGFEFLNSRQDNDLFYLHLEEDGFQLALAKIIQVSKGGNLMT